MLLLEGRDVYTHLVPVSRILEGLAACGQAVGLSSFADIHNIEDLKQSLKSLGFEDVALWLSANPNNLERLYGLMLENASEEEVVKALSTTEEERAEGYGFNDADDDS